MEDRINTQIDTNFDFISVNVQSDLQFFYENVSLSVYNHEHRTWFHR